MASFASSRPIPGAVATAGVSERIAFLRRTYGLLGAALIAWAGITAGMMTLMTDTSVAFSAWALNGRWNWFLVLGAFMLIGYGAERLATSDSSRGLQYAGLTLAVVAQALILQPLLWLVIVRFDGSSVDPYALIGQAAGITIAIFVGLTATVFVTKKDFSFMRGALMIGSFAALGVIVASMIFGFQLGALFAGVMVLLMAGYILYQTSLVMEHFPPTHHVAAALMLFSTIATLFWYVLQLLMSLRRD
jgi:FtsH-binding integral membrane protein